MLLLMKNSRSQYRRQRLAPRPTSIVGANHWPRGAARGRATYVTSCPLAAGLNIVPTNYAVAFRE